jgi:hypothetical protein
MCDVLSFFLRKLLSLGTNSFSSQKVFNAVNLSKEFVMLPFIVIYEAISVVITQKGHRVFLLHAQETRYSTAAIIPKKKVKVKVSSHQKCLLIILSQMGS